MRPNGLTIRAMKYKCTAMHVVYSGQLLFGAIQILCHVKGVGGSFEFCDKV